LKVDWKKNHHISPKFYKIGLQAKVEKILKEFKRDTAGPQIVSYVITLQKSLHNSTKPSNKCTEEGIWSRDCLYYHSFLEEVKYEENIQKCLFTIQRHITANNEYKSIQYCSNIQGDSSP
jgi:hypothetical protein